MRRRLAVGVTIMAPVGKYSLYVLYGLGFATALSASRSARWWKTSALVGRRKRQLANVLFERQHPPRQARPIEEGVAAESRSGPGPWNRVAPSMHVVVQRLVFVDDVHRQQLQGRLADDRERAMLDVSQIQ